METGAFLYAKNDWMIQPGLFTGVCKMGGSRDCKLIELIMVDHTHPTIAGSLPPLSIAAIGEIIDVLQLLARLKHLSNGQRTTEQKHHLALFDNVLTGTDGMLNGQSQLPSVTKGKTHHALFNLWRRWICGGASCQTAFTGGK